MKARLINAGFSVSVSRKKGTAKAAENSAPAHIHRPPTDFVRKPREKHDAENLSNVAKHHAGNRHLSRHVQSVDDVAEAEHREQVAKPVLRETRADHDEEIAGMPAQRLDRRGSQGGPPRIRLDEHRGLGNTSADIDTEPK
jgi:hypothetical protein